MNQPILQVMIPAYGESPYLRDTLLSAVTQLPKEVGITVLEDPSDSDNVAKIVQEFSNRVQYLKNPNRLGIAGNFNKSIELSNARFTLICGSDDLILGDLSKDLNSVESENVAAVISNCKIINQSGKRINPLADKIKKVIAPSLNKEYRFKNKNFFNRLMLGDWMYFPSIAWNTEILKKQKFSDQFHTAMDLDIFVRLLERGYEVLYIPTTKFAYRRHSQSASSRYANEAGRFTEELTCHSNALVVAKRKNWRLAVFLAHLAITVRLHGLLKALIWLFKFQFNRSIKLMVISLTPLTSKKLGN